MRRTHTLLLLAAVAAQLTFATAGQAEEQRSGVAYIRSAGETVPGYFYKPEGKGPFPAVIIVRAASRAVSDSNPPTVELAKSFTSRGYVVVIPCWHVPTDVAGDNANDPTKKNRRMTLPEFQGMARDIAASVTWAKTQAFVDEDRVAVIGHATGAILTMLLAEQEVGVRGFIAFSPAAAVWNDRIDLQKTFVNAVRESKAPIFLIQAQNDFTLGPSELLGKELSHKGDQSFCKVYPPYGITREQGNNFAMTGSNVWGEDVFKFLRQVLN